VLAVVGILIAELVIRLAERFVGWMLDEADCERYSAPNDALIQRTVIGALPAGSTRNVGTADDPCDAFVVIGRVTALWGTVLASTAVDTLQAQGWKRLDPVGGPPAWYTAHEGPGGSRRYPDRDCDVHSDLTWGRQQLTNAIVLTRKVEGRRFCTEIDAGGLDAYVSGP